MSQPSEETLLAFLEGRLEEAERARLLDRLDTDPGLASQLWQAAVGMEAFRSLGDVAVASSDPGRARSGPRRVSPWWAVAASAATLALAVPVTLQLAESGQESLIDPGAMPPSPGDATGEVVGGMPMASEPSFVLVLHGTWPDASGLDQAETRRRAAEYWNWTTSLAEQGILVAAGDLRWEPGERLGPTGTRVSVPGEVVGTPDYLVGMLALRVSTYEEALELARACPHLRYGGSISVRRVGSGFVTVSGMGDWSD